MPFRDTHPDLVRLVVGERGQRRDGDRTGSAVRLRGDRALGHAPRRWRRCAPSRARHGALAHAGASRRPEHRKPSANLRWRRARRCRSCSATRHRIWRRRRRSIRMRRWSETEAFWIEWSQQVQARRALLRCRDPLADHTEGADLLRRPAAWSAAPTTSLPEQLGGVRNWDYRFCWLRDATLTLLALMNAGYCDEAQAWREWLLRAVAGSPEQVQIMYGIAGERRLTEWEVPWLPGYEGAAPVRIGNAAARPAPARRVRRGHGRAAPGALQAASPPANPAGPCSAPCSSISNGSGPSRTRASGRSAGRRGISPIRR